MISALAVAGGYLGLAELEARARANPSSLLGLGWGRLRPIHDDSTGLPLLQLPEGFRYRSFGWAGDPMVTGEATPPLHDGMAVVASDDGRLLLMRNHEIVWERAPFSSHVPVYDPRVGGGTTRLSFNPDDGAWLETRPTLSGTLVNCAGGPTPWGSWLTCEEAVVDLDGRLGPLFGNGTIANEHQHGYVFEVPSQGAASARPLLQMGRFRHEAAAVDPDTGIVYLTEDNQPASGVYRFVPVTPGRLADGGQLQMMCVQGFADMRQDVPLRTWADVDWVDIDDPDAGHTPGTLDSAGVYNQGKRQGGSTFSRPEGCWLRPDGRVCLSDTTGGNVGCGQLFLFDPTEQRLQVMFESPQRKVLDHPDNITVSPNGTLVICEDRPFGVQRMHAITPVGQIVQLAQNNVVLDGERNGLGGNFTGAEWAGACFSPDGRWLFVNIQDPGITFAITGPWQDGLRV